MPATQSVSRSACLMMLASLVLGFAGYASAAPEAAPTPSPAAPAPLKALLVTGGCCHDYDFQAKTLTAGVSQRARVEWTIVNEGGKGTKAQIKLYEKEDWAKGYDVVVHNECFADTNDPAYIARITKAHKDGVPAVVIHCAMHTYRSLKTDDWREFLGVTSKHHEHQSKYPVKVVAADHPVMKGFPADWVTPKDELYVIEKLWPTATALATSRSEKTKQDQPVFWVNTYGKARVFGTTWGHGNETIANPNFLDVVSRGLLWSTDKLADDGKPKPGYEPPPATTTPAPAAR